MPQPDVTPLAVPASLQRIRSLLPAPPARIVEVGCGRGALAAALAGCGYQVVGVEPNPEAAAGARARHVEVLEMPLVRAAPTGVDVVLFTQSLHHVDDLGETVQIATAALAPGGSIVLEEFARERADPAATAYVDDAIALLSAAGAASTHGDQPWDASIDPLLRWRTDRAGLHTGVAMLEALRDSGLLVQPVAWTETLWRLVASRIDGLGLAVAEAIAGILRDIELRRIGDGTLPAIGFVTAAQAAK